jgi:hypothetical protein
MMEAYFFYFLVLVLLIYILITRYIDDEEFCSWIFINSRSFFRVIPKTVGFLLMKLTSIEIKFGSISLSKAKNIQIIYKGYEVEIEEVALKSNFLNSEISNPLQIFVRDVRINKNIEYSDEAVVRKVSKSSSNEPIKQIPTFLVTFFQVCCCYLIDKQFR